MSEQQYQDGAQWLEKLMALSGLAAGVEAKTIVDDINDGCWLVIDQSQLSQEQIEAVIGDRGGVLDSIQYLANTVLNLGLSRDDQQAYTVELDGYRARRQEELKVLADKAAKTVKDTQTEYEIPALSSAERRQVHSLLTSYEDLETFSRGREPDRRLVVRLAGQAD
ncbi:MAG: R3H domain-containing nucleic acid-binding protein [Cyanobacteria bacterium P01_H01_bin.119]